MEATLLNNFLWDGDSKINNYAGEARCDMQSVHLWHNDKYVTYFINFTLKGHPEIENCVSKNS